MAVRLRTLLLLLALVAAASAQRKVTPKKAAKAAPKAAPKVAPKKTVVAPGLSLDFYNVSCPEIEAIVHDVTYAEITRAKELAADLVRLHFHDCFVQGCDASLLLALGNNVELTAPQNDGIEAMGTINKIKTTLEARCPGIVSCSDIVALATREAVAFAGGPFTAVKLGRRDGVTSIASRASALPDVGPLQPIINKFSAQGFDAVDVVTLSGAHTFGHTECDNTKSAVGSNLINPRLRTAITNTCATPGIDEVNLDPITPPKFDNQYFKNVLNGTGVLLSDLVLAADQRTLPTVQQFARSQAAFFNQWQISWTKLAENNVLTGRAGEIRKRCDLTNAQAP